MISRERFVELAQGERPVVVRVAADLETDVDPLTAYAALTGRTAGIRDDANGGEDTADARGDAPEAGSEYSFLLESGEKVASSDPDGAFRAGDGADRHARFSFVGYDPEAVVTVHPDRTEVSVLDERYDGLLTPDVDADSAGSDGQSAGSDGQSAGSDGQYEAGDGDTLARLRDLLPDVALRGFPETDRQHLDGGLVGFLSYEAAYDCWLDEVGVERPDSRFPDAQFVLNTRTVTFDHARGTTTLVSTPVVRESDDAGAVYDDVVREIERVNAILADAGSVETGGFRRAPGGGRAGPREEYEAAVRRAKEHVLDGDIYQGVVSRTRELVGEVDPLGLYRALRDVNPSPYMYVLAHDDLTIVGASPETLVSVRGQTVVSNPIAGTCPRGPSPVEDRRLAGEMLADGKERAEHTMLVDLARNDVRRVAQPGTVRVGEFMNVLKYSHVQHIESTVTGRLRADCDAFDATRAAFPAGTLAGAPKIRAMELIDDLERSPRGPYGGGVGYYSWTGDADFAIVIRTATVERDVATDRAGLDRAGLDRAGLDRISVRAGAGIVADSDPASEYEETEQKMDGVLTALEAIADGSMDSPSDGSGDGAGAGAGGDPGEEADADGDGSVLSDEAEARR